MTQPPARDRLEIEMLSMLGMNAGYVIDVYVRWRESPLTVSPHWRVYFERLARGEISAHELPSPLDAANGGTDPAPDPAAAAPADTDTDTDTDEESLEPLRGGAARVVRNMEASREIPSATSYRSVPVKVLEENRRFLNLHLALGEGGKISFTHVIAWALIEALTKHPVLNHAYTEVGGEPHRRRRPHVHLGLAVDLEKKDAGHTLLVPVIRGVDAMDFRTFLARFDHMVDRARRGLLEPADFQGATVTLTNPGTVGTAMSSPRLMPGQGAIIATGAIGYSAATRAMSRELLSRLGISKQMTISCTYDHRVIQGAESGAFLGEVEALLQGEHGFYDRLYEDLGVPYHPVRWTPDVNPPGLGAGGSTDEITRQARVLQLINAYRVRGHLIAHLDPLGQEPQYHPELDPETYGLTLWDLDRTFITGAGPSPAAWAGQAPLREILETLRAAYCGRIGVEYMNIQVPELKRWIQERLEPAATRTPLVPAQRRRLLTRLVETEVFEHFLHTKFPGHKRFSLEGAEALVPVLQRLFEEGARAGVEEIVLGMAHRGRLTVLTQCVGVSPESLFVEFQGSRDPFLTQGSGDVKYHLGAKGVHRAETGADLALTLAPNPSHLEAVDPVVEGIVRAKQEARGAERGRAVVLPVLIHGDAAFAGEGVVAETLNLSQLKGYRTGGTVHIIVNNQIGFTTPVESARSSPYPTDVAKMGQAPVFHVNGDDPEAALRALDAAFAFRMEFHRDVVIDLVCYRRHGHSEADEPSYTQPRLYAQIREHASVAERYGRQLVREGVLDGETIEVTRREAWAGLERALARIGEGSAAPMRTEPIVPAVLHPGAPAVPRPTAVEAGTLRRLGDALATVGPGVNLHPKLVRWMAKRAEAVERGEGIDWALAEALAFGSLVLEGVPVRLSGQDSVRGTFSQRHLLLHDDVTDSNWMPLQNLWSGQAPFVAVDSPLSEEAVLGFEFGYSLGDPRALVLWEAQFGDFVNEAQVVIDQFLAGAKAKWGQPSSLVLLLPHGYEGQGPEHSNARPERFLQLAAEDNLRIANCSTPAQYFHVLRRQVCALDAAPLVLFTPKSGLRHPRVVSSLRDLAQGRFEPVLPDPRRPEPRRVRRLLLCTGKIAYDLEALRDTAGREDVAIVRVEQLYPFPDTALREVLAAYAGAQATWVQEEPRNMGAWMYMSDRLRSLPGPTVDLRYVGRAESASPATGYLEVHIRDQERLVREALDLE